MRTATLSGGHVLRAGSAMPTVLRSWVIAGLRGRRPVNRHFGQPSAAQYDLWLFDGFTGVYLTEGTESGNWRTTQCVDYVSGRHYSLNVGLYCATCPRRRTISVIPSDFR